MFDWHSFWIGFRNVLFLLYGLLGMAAVTISGKENEDTRWVAFVITLAALAVGIAMGRGVFIGREM